MPALSTLEAPEIDRLSIEDRLSAIESQLQRVPNPDSLNLLVFSGERDRLLAAFVMATGAAACGQEVTLFFTFWATAALRKPQKVSTQKSLVERAFGWMLPRGLNRTRLSQMDFGGMGRAMMSREMRQKNIADLDQLIATAAELGVRIRVCEMSMKLMGIQPCELIDYPALEFCGIASFADSCSQSNTTFMI
jgi:peroxiredoxin family protein